MINCNFNETFEYHDLDGCKVVILDVTIKNKCILKTKLAFKVISGEGVSKEILEHYQHYIDYEGNSDAYICTNCPINGEIESPFANPFVLNGYETKRGELIIVLDKSKNIKLQIVKDGKNLWERRILFHFENKKIEII